MKRNFLLPLLGLVAGLGTAFAQTKVSVTTHHNDNARTGQNLNETVLNTQNVNPARFGKIFERSLNSRCWSQPLVAADINIPSLGRKVNVVYVQTEVGDIFAFDADDPAQTKPLWSRSLSGQQCYGTGVIDLSRNTLYSTVRRQSGSTVSFAIVALDLSTGADKATSQVITGSVPGTGRGSVNGQMSFYPSAQRQRPGLLLQNGVVYVAFGGGVSEYTPGIRWNGWIFGYDAATLKQAAIFCTAPNANGAGIWQAGNGMVGDGTAIYATTGNGSGDGSAGNPFSVSTMSGGHDYGDSVIKLVPDGKGGLTVTDFWTPYNWQFMETYDKDLGSAGQILVPGTNILVTGDKIGGLYTLNRNNLGKFTEGSNNIAQELPTGLKGHLHGGAVYYKSPDKGPLIYIWAEHDYLKAYKALGNTGLNPTPVMMSPFQVPPGMPGGFMSVSSNQSSASSALIWVSAPYIGDANLGDVPGILRVFAANDLSRELYNSEVVSTRDSVGTFSKFSPPTVANGKVYLSTFATPGKGAKLEVFGLLPATALPATPLNLAATANIGNVRLTWNSSANATIYTLKRADAASGPYTIIGSNLRTTEYVDRAVVGGKTYFYTVSASNAGGNTPESAPVSATVPAVASGNGISIDFVGGTSSAPVTAIKPTETAGMVKLANWNAVSGSSGTLTNVRDSSGAQTSASMTFTGGATDATNITDSGNDWRMMKGSLRNAVDGNIRVVISNLPAKFLSKGYDLYLYSDGLNVAGTRVMTFTVNGVSRTLTDSRNRDFDGTFFTPGIADVANTLIYENQTSATVDLTISYVSTTDDRKYVNLNGLQIVARDTVAPAPTPTPVTVPTATPKPTPTPGGSVVLTATAANNAVSLNWTTYSGATNYSVGRATKAGGPYTTMTSTGTTPRWSDTRTVNGTIYYYRIAAQNAANTVLAYSNEAAATPSTAAIGRVISVDFGGSGTKEMAETEIAGAPGVERAHWNKAFGATGSIASAIADNGAKSGTTLSWNFARMGDTTILESPGQYRMMRGYLNGGTTPGTITITKVPTDFITNGCDLYIYFDAVSSGSRVMKYSVGGYGVNATDAPSTDFKGTYTLANTNNGIGNFVKLLDFRTNTITLTITPVSASDGKLGSIINGLQIVSRKATTANTTSTTKTSSPTGSVSAD